MAKGEINGWVITSPSKKLILKTFSYTKKNAISKFTTPTPATWRTFEDAGFNCIRAKLMAIGSGVAVINSK